MLFYSPDARITIFFHRVAAIVNLCATTFQDHFIFQRSECPGHLMDLIFFWTTTV